MAKRGAHGEPWFVYRGHARDKDGWQLTTRRPESELGSSDVPIWSDNKKRERAIACVNAMDGIGNPGALREMLRACCDLADLGPVDEDDYTDEMAERIDGIWRRIYAARAKLEIDDREENDNDS